MLISIGLLHYSLLLHVSLLCADSAGVDNGEEGLPSPPLDPGALLASTRANSIEMSHFFDDFLDDLCMSSLSPDAVLLH